MQKVFIILITLTIFSSLSLLVLMKNSINLYHLVLYNHIDNQTKEKTLLSLFSLIIKDLIHY